METAETLIEHLYAIKKEFKYYGTDLMVIVNVIDWQFERIKNKSTKTIKLYNKVRKTLFK